MNNYFKFAMQLYFKPTTAKMLTNLKVDRWQPPRKLGIAIPLCRFL